jgi:hypothetical protein
MGERRKVRHDRSLDERLAEEARKLRLQAKELPQGMGREALLRKARQAETAARMNEWLTSPGLVAPN